MQDLIFGSIEEQDVDNWRGNTKEGKRRKESIYSVQGRPDHAFSASYLEGTKEDYYSGKKKGGDISGDDNLGGWWLTDDKDEPRRYRIPSTNILAGDYLVIEEDNDNNPLNIPPASYFGGAFSLSSHGEEVYLFSPDLRYSHGFEFGAAETGVSFGRYVTSQGDEHFPAQVANSLGSSNEGPKIGPVVISEIMYHPGNGDHEFIELANISPSGLPSIGQHCIGIRMVDHLTLAGTIFYNHVQLVSNVAGYTNVL